MGTLEYKFEDRKEASWKEMREPLNRVSLFAAITLFQGLQAPRDSSDKNKRKRAVHSSNPTQQS